MAASARTAPGGFAEIAEWGARVITQTFTPETHGYEGRLVADIARGGGQGPLRRPARHRLCRRAADHLLPVATFPSADDWRAAASVWRDGRAVIGASDAGAHLDFIAYFDYPVYVLEHAVREHGVLSLEEAIHLLTDVPARLYGLRDRGQLVEGAWADIVVLDESTVGSGTLATRFDLPAGAGRLYAEPTGISHVLVNGEPVVADGKLTDARPGTLLRSGRDTRTPEAR